MNMAIYVLKSNQDKIDAANAEVKAVEDYLTKRGWVVGGWEVTFDHGCPAIKISARTIIPDGKLEAEND